MIEATLYEEHFVIRGSVVFAACVIPLIAASVGAQTFLKREAFDSDPKWDGKKNITKVDPVRVTQDFGFTHSNHAAGKADGEIGGSVWRSTTPAYYGRPLRAPKTLNEPLHSSGTFVVTQSNGTSSLWVGFFNPETIS